MAMALYQLARKLRHHGVNLEQSKATVTGPEGVRRPYAFVGNGRVYGTRFFRESDSIANFEIDAICRAFSIESARHHRLATFASSRMLPVPPWPPR